MPRFVTITILIFSSLRPLASASGFLDHLKSLQVVPIFYSLLFHRDSRFLLPDKLRSEPLALPITTDFSDSNVKGIISFPSSSSGTSREENQHSENTAENSERSHQENSASDSLILFRRYFQNNEPPDDNRFQHHTPHLKACQLCNGDQCRYRAEYLHVCLNKLLVRSVNEMKLFEYMKLVASEANDYMLERQNKFKNHVFMFFRLEYKSPLPSTSFPIPVPLSSEFKSGLIIEWGEEQMEAAKSFFRLMLERFNEDLRSAGFRLRAIRLDALKQGVSTFIELARKLKEPLDKIMVVGGVRYKDSILYPAIKKASPEFDHKCITSEYK